MTEEEYLLESSRTLSTEYHSELISPGEIDRTLQAIITVGAWADDLKKALFYGKPYLRPVSATPGSLHHPLDGGLYLHAALGIMTEAVEIIEHLYDIYTGKSELDTINLKEEIGDIEWYLAIFYRILQTTPNKIKIKNIAKLRARYPERFTSTDALQRDLAEERKVLEA